MLSDNDRESEHVLQIAENPYVFSVCSIREYQLEIIGWVCKKEPWQESRHTTSI